MSKLVGRVARHPLASVLVGLLSILISAGLTAYLGIPGADAHDERSYLLAADTFAHGRLTNPAHPMWEHLEAFHVLHQPTYQSKYPPGQGLALALGKVLADQAIVGAWLSTALACAAVTWALRAWLPARWALAAGLLTATHWLVWYWSQNYWGGSLAACGGALVFGAVGRLRREVTVSSGVILAVGAAVLLFTRPYEGLVFGLLVLPLLPLREVLRRAGAVAGIVMVMAAALGFQAYYNYRVTGSPLLLPYVLYERQYSEAPSFVFMPARPGKEYRHELFRILYQDSELRSVYEPQRSLWGFAKFAGVKAGEFAKAYLFPAAPAIGLLGVPLLWGRRDRNARTSATCYAGAAVVIFVAAMTLTNWLFPHYAAPILTVLMFVQVDGIRRMTARHRLLCRITLPLLLAASLVIGGVWAHGRLTGGDRSWADNREEMIRRIQDQPGGPHLVLVRYEQINNLNHDWIGNAADIDSSPIVWARDMGPEKNQELLRYFANRKPWLMTVVGDDLAVEPYTPR